MSTKCIACVVEFVGGPIDGHFESLDYPPEPFIFATTTRPGLIGQWLRWLLPRRKAAGTIAVYELHERNGQLRYRHAGSSATSRRPLRCICVDVPGQ